MLCIDFMSYVNRLTTKGGYGHEKMVYAFFTIRCSSIDLD